MEITHPRRLLAVSLESEAGVLGGFMRDLTGTHPAGGDGGGLAGSTHDLPLRTAYYRATVPVWLDTPAAPADWADSFLAPEAREVLDVLGGVAVVFALDPAAAAPAPARGLVEAVGRVVDKGLGGWAWDGVGLAVGVGDGPAHVLDQWEEVCARVGLEFVHARPGGGDGGRNEFGEKMGIQRILEALESNDWALDTDADGLGLDDDDGGGDDDDDSSSDGFGRFVSADDLHGGRRRSTDLDPASMGFGFDKADFEGLRRAIWSSGVEEDEEDKAEEGKVKPSAGQAESSSSEQQQQQQQQPGDGEGDERQDELGHEDVEKVEAMMRKLLAAREMGAGLPEQQRKRLAARAVGEVMREL